MATNSKKTTTATDSKDVSFESALSELNAVVTDLESGTLSLDDSLARYEQGIRYLNVCQTMLRKAERKIEVLSGVDAEGNPITQQFEEGEMTLEEKAASRSRRRTAHPTHSAKSKPPAASGEEPDIGQPDNSEGSNRVRNQSSIDPDDIDIGGRLF